jgi:transposase-like protein
MEIEALAGRRWSSNEARTVLRAQECSGLSIHAFAREHGLSHERLYRWQRKLASDGGGAPEDELAEIEFTPVVVTNSRAPVAMTVRVDGVELELADPMAVEPTWLATVVAVLRSR